jgi:hypothetical protein
LDIAIAGSLALTSASFTANALTLANTQGTSSATNIGATTAQYYVLRLSSLAAAVTITAPSVSKTYLVVNADATYSATVKASGQSGVSVVAGEKAIVYFNGTDYIKVASSVLSNSTGTLPVANGGTGLTSLTAGYIPFGAGTSAFSSSSSLFWDSANNRLGVGTATPTAPLSVSISSAGASPSVTIANTDLTSGGAVRANLLSGDDGTVGRTRAIIEAATDGANNGRLSFYTRNAGTNVEQLRITYAGGISFGSSGTNYGTSGQVLTSAGNASPTWATPTTGTVTSVGWTGGIVSVATATTTPAFTIAGTSGGIPYFSSGTTWATSAALAASAIVLGGGAGAAPATTTTGTGVVTALGSAANAAGGFTTIDGTATLTNKRITARVASATTATTLTPSVATADIYAYTALASALAINAPGGTPVDGDKLLFRILDNGTTRVITWNATFTSMVGTAFTNTFSTTAGKTTYVGCIYNASGTPRWDVIAVTTQA